MLEAALKARLPILTVQTGDVASAPTILQTFASLVGWKCQVEGFGRLSCSPSQMQSNTLYYGFAGDSPTIAMMEGLTKFHSVLVLLNSQHPLATPMGMLLPHRTDVSRVFKELKLQERPDVLAALKGLELRAIRETCLLAMAAHGSVSAATIRAVRSVSYEAMPGLTTVPTDLDFYEPSQELQEWVSVNVRYLVHGRNPKLVPRGVMFSGPPGVGKTLGAKYIASKAEVPLFRLDVAASLNRFIGVSESQIARTLQFVDREEPCVLLVDEVEKIFRGQEEGTTQRILGQLLWWLQEHRTRVLTVMTTNNHSMIPPELYRTGRIDRVLSLQALSRSSAQDFILRAFGSITGRKPSLKQVEHLRQAVADSRRHEHSHADLYAMAADAIKAQNWD